MTRTLALFPLALAFGCNGELDAYLPTVNFDRLDVKDATWEDVSTDFVFKVNNPNPIDVTLARFDYALAFQGVEWVNGDDPDGLTLGASGDSELALPVDVVFQSLYDVVQATRGEDTIEFGLDGSFGFNTPLGVVDLPYSEDGGFPALRTPSIKLGKLRVEDLSFTSATLALDLDVDNDHASNLWFENFAYSVSLAGVDIGTGLVQDLGEVDGATTGTLSLPLTVDFLDAGAAVYEAITSSSVNIGIGASTDVDTPFGLIPLDFDQSDIVRVDY